MKRLTVENLATLFLTHVKATKAPRTYEHYRSALAPFLAVAGPLKADKVRPYLMLDFPASWHGIHAVQRLYKWAHEEQGILAENPMAKLKRPRPRARRSVLDRTTIARILRAAAPDLRRYLIFLRETAARPQEANGADWSMMRAPGRAHELAGHLAAGRAHLAMSEFKGRARSNKPGRLRIIPLTPRAGRMLLRIGVPLARRGPIFTTAAGKVWNKDTLRNRFRALLPRAHVPAVLDGERVCCYQFRHFRATEFAAAGMQANVLQTLLGHASITMTQRYVHLEEQQLLDAWQRSYGK